MLRNFDPISAFAALPAPSWRIDVLVGLFVLSAIAVAIAQQTLP